MAGFDQPGTVSGDSGAGRPRVLLVAPHGSYRTAAYVDTAARLGIELLLVSEGRDSIVSAYAAGLHVDLQDPRRAAERVLQQCGRDSVTGVIASDDSTTELASRISRLLGLTHNHPGAARISRRKDLARQCQQENGLRVPSFRRVDLDQPLLEQIHSVDYPCVAKPLAMSASRGVIRANSSSELLSALKRIERIVADEHQRDERRCVLVESFIPGREYAFEGLLENGRLVPLAIIEKPDPLDGPYFEETFYISPSRLQPDRRQEMQECVQSVCKAYGLCEGPVHAECRVNEHGVWVLELAARTIGGLCSRLFRFGSGLDLEEVVLRHAMRESVKVSAGQGHSGVLMIPVPGAGLLRRVEGIAAARRVRFVDEVVIQIREGYELVPLPEGAGYPGFIFATAPEFECVESALRTAHAHLNFVRMPRWSLRAADR